MVTVPHAVWPAPFSMFQAVGDAGPFTIGDAIRTVDEYTQQRHRAAVGDGNHIAAARGAGERFTILCGEIGRDVCQFDDRVFLHLQSKRVDISGFVGFIGHVLRVIPDAVEGLAVARGVSWICVRSIWDIGIFC